MDKTNKKRSAGQAESHYESVGNKSRSTGPSAPEGTSGKSRPGVPNKATSGSKGAYSQIDAAEKDGRKYSRAGRAGR